MKSLMSIIFVGVAAMIFFTWTQPIFNDIKSLYGEEQTLNTTLANFKVFQTKRDNVLSQYNAISKDDLTKLNRFLPSMSNAVDLVVEIENIAKVSGLALKDIDIKKPEDTQKSSFEDQKSGVGKILVTMKVVGPYKSFVSFLGNLEKNLRPIEIERITFISGNADSYEYNITADTYWKK